jgi:hypothetical protein
MKELLLFLYFLSILVSIEGQIQRFPSGETLVNRIADGTIRFLQWRAGANPLDEIRGLTSLFGWTAFALSAVFVLARYVSPQFFPEKLAFIAFWTLGLWSLFALFRDYKKDWQRPVMFASVAITWPWILPPLGYPFPEGLLPAFKLVLGHLGLPTTDTAISVTLSIMGLLSAVLMELFALSIPITFFFLLWVSVKVSSTFLRNKPVWLYHGALTYYVVATMYYLAKSEFAQP